MKTRGLVLGKFLPPHAGHLRLTAFASALVDELTVVVASHLSESIDGELRHRWMTELVPGARVLHLTEVLPAKPSAHPAGQADFWRMWRRSLLRLLGEPPTHVFASEAYGATLAQTLGATFIPLARPTSESDGPLPISGTALRRAPWEHWHHLPRVVRPHFLRRIHVAGPESSGKTTLAAHLAAHFQTTWVPEYARTWLTRPNAPMRDGVACVTAEDMVTIAHGHRASRQALERSATHRVFSDTDALATVLWAELLLGDAPEEVRAIAAEERPDLTLLLAPDMPFVPDPVRYAPEERWTFFERYREALADTGRAFVVIDGSFEDRAAAAVEAALAVPPPPALD